MIHLYSGTPGSGKSFHATEKIFYRLRMKKNVICNYPISLENCSYSALGFWIKQIFKKFKPHKKKLGKFDYVPNNELTVQYLKDYARKNHKGHREHETLVVIDECGIKFNPRTFAQADRLEWIEFFSLHRHYGYDFILVSQSDRMVDRQIRSFFEYNHQHRNVGNFKLFGKILALLCGGSLFTEVTVFYSIREKVNSNFFKYKRRIASLYDTFLLYDTPEDVDEHPEQHEDVPCRNGDAAAEQGGDPSATDTPVNPASDVDPPV